MKKKIVELSKKKKILLIVITLLIVILTTAATVLAFKSNEDTYSENKTQESVIEEDKIPEVTKQNTKFEISATEPTQESVFVKVTSKLDKYNLYYYIEPIEQEKEEIENENKIQNLKKLKKEYIKYEDKIEININSNIYFKYELNGEYSLKEYLLKINNIEREEILDEALENEEATEEQLKKEKVSKISNSARYYITVNYASNVVTIYSKDAEGNYTVPVKAMVCSCGSATPKSGIYKLKSARYKWRALFGGVYGQYAVPIVGNILFHSVPYTATNNSALEYWEYDKLGTTASAGCIRLTVSDALWIFNNCGSGTQIEFSATAPSPLGKPSARKISSYPELRGYDPTDPIANNPWRSANINTPEPKPEATTPQTTTSPEPTQTINNNEGTDEDKNTEEQEKPEPTNKPEETEESGVEDKNPEGNNSEEVEDKTEQVKEETTVNEK